MQVSRKVTAVYKAATLAGHWVLELECGHELIVAANGKPTRKTSACERCGKTPAPVWPLGAAGEAPAGADAEAEAGEPTEAGLARFYDAESMRKLFVEADQEADAIMFCWLTIRDSHPEDNLRDPEEAAGAVVIVRGDGPAKELARWAEQKGFITQPSEPEPWGSPRLPHETNAWLERMEQEGKTPSPPAKVEQGKPTKEQILAARALLAKVDPIGEAMEVLAAAGCYNCRVSGTTPSRMRFKSEGGAPTPPPARARKGGGL